MSFRDGDSVLLSRLISALFWDFSYRNPRPLFPVGVLLVGALFRPLSKNSSPLGHPSWVPS